MKIFVTVGTTKFDTLIETVDNLKNINLYEVIFQISDGSYTPRNGEYFSFTNNLSKIVDDCDLIISHAGAGSIYSLLEKQKKIIVVPNFERRDKHQMEIAQYCYNKNYCGVAFELSDLHKLIAFSQVKEYSVYKKDDFFLAGDILDLFV